MRIHSVLLALSAIQAVIAHTLFTNLIIADVDQGPGACIRMPLYTTSATAPVTDLSSPDMACGYNGTFGVYRVCKVEQGSVLTFQFKEYPDNSNPGVLASGHKGPCSVYMNYVDSAVADAGVRNGWFKIYEEGYDKSVSQWCTDTLIQNKGLLSVVVPTELAGGYYLVRPELMTLQQGNSTPSFFTGCAQIFLDSPETTLPKDVVSIPGYIKAGDPTLQFDITVPKLPYTVPGPRVYRSDVSPTIQQPSLPFQGEGVIPQNSVLTNANWFGIELGSYSTVEGCKNATTSCYDQSTACFSSAGPIGTVNCNIWTKKCETMESSCNAGNYTGPPSRGKNLNPTPSAILSTNMHAATDQPSGSAKASVSAPASVTSAPKPTSNTIAFVPVSSTPESTLSTATSLSLSISSSPASVLSNSRSISSPTTSLSAPVAIESISLSSSPVLTPSTVTSLSVSTTSVSTLSVIDSAPGSKTSSSSFSTISSISISRPSPPALTAITSESPFTGSGSGLGITSSSSSSSNITQASNTIASPSLSNTALPVSSPVASSSIPSVAMSTIRTVASSFAIGPTTSTVSIAAAGTTIPATNSSRSAVVMVTTIVWTPSAHPTLPLGISAFPPLATQSSSSLENIPTYSPAPDAKVSPDGRCGSEKGYTCLGNQNGPCCSSSGYCGSTQDYCGKMYCQPLWGHCDGTTGSVKFIRHRHRHLNRDYWV